MKNVLVVDGNDYYSPFAHIGNLCDDVAILEKDPESVVLVVFTGGEDVSPSYYGEEKQPRTYCNPRRDAFEHKVFKKALDLKLPMAGICRGAQFLCVMAGGKLHQHVDNHSTYHDVRTNDGRKVYVSSTHHQMQIPPNGAKVLAWSEPNRHFKEGIEVDCAYYPNINALGMQYHPEYQSPDSAGFKYAQELASLLMEGKL